MGQLKFRYTAGILIRGQIRRELERICFDYNLELNINESKGFLDTECFVQIKGDDSVLASLSPAIENWMKGIAEE